VLALYKTIYFIKTEMGDKHLHTWAESSVSWRSSFFIFRRFGLVEKKGLLPSSRPSVSLRLSAYIISTAPTGGV